MTLPHISVRDVQYRYLCNGFEITVTTDIACHLYMRWTRVKPQKHIIPMYLRGIYMHGDTYFCFVAYTDNEQEEAGDTLIHTFVKRSWPVCETRWFHFWGSEAGIVSPSTTAIFELHFAIEIASYYNSISNRTLQKNAANWWTAHDAAAGDILPWHDPPQCYLYVWTRLTASYWIRRSFLFFNTTLLDPAISIGEARLDLWLVNKAITSSVGRPHIYITQGVQNDPVITANYGDQLPYTTIGGQVDIRDLILNQYNSILLNSAGRLWINAGGITKFCLRGQMDVEDIAPPLGTNEIQYYSEQKGLGYRPILTIRGLTRHKKTSKVIYDRENFFTKCEN